MKATFVSKENNDVTFQMSFTAEEFESAIIKAYQRSKGKFSLDGFRQGKAPRKLIESKYGDDIFHEDAINQLFGEEYLAAIDALDLEPVGRPSAEFGTVENGKGFDVTVKTTVAPKIELKDYKGIKIKKVETTVSDEDVENELKALQKRNSRMVAVDRPAKEGDTVLIDYAGFLGDEQFEGGTAERQPVSIGSDTFIPGFEEQLIGAAPGEERDLNITFPEEYQEDLAGKEAVFKCTVHEVKETELPEIDDEFAKDVSEFDTLDALKEDTREKLEKRALDKAEYETKNAVIEKLYEENDIEIPDVMVEEQIDEMLREFDQQLRQQGMDLKTYSEYLQKDVNDYRTEMKDDAFKRVKMRLLIEAVADAESLGASDEDVEKELTDMAKHYNMEPEELKKAMGIEGLSYLVKDIRNRKAVDLLFENAVIEA